MRLKRMQQALVLAGGIEPPSALYESAARPLSYASLMVLSEGIEPSCVGLEDLAWYTTSESVNVGPYLLRSY